MQKELKILLIVAAIFTLAGGLFGPIYAIFVEEIGGDVLTAGTAYAAFSIAAGVLIFLISRWEDRVKHQEKLVVIGFVLTTLGFLGYLLIRNPIDLFIVQIIFGIGEAIGTPAYDGLYSKHLDKGKFISEWGLWESSHWIVLAVAAGLGSLFASLYGFRSLFIIMFILSVIGLFVSLLLLSKNRNKRKR